MPTHCERSEQARELEWEIVIDHQTLFNSLVTFDAVTGCNIELHSVLQQKRAHEHIVVVPILASVLIDIQIFEYPARIGVTNAQLHAGRAFVWVGTSIFSQPYDERIVEIGEVSHICDDLVDYAQQNRRVKKGEQSEPARG